MLQKSFLKLSRSTAEIILENIQILAHSRGSIKEMLQLSSSHSPPIYHQQKSTPLKHLNTAEYQRSSFLKKLKKSTVGAKKS